MATGVRLSKSRQPERRQRNEGGYRTSDYPPLTRSEIVDIERRARAGEMLARVELERVERQSPIVDGELLMTCYSGRLFLKRYLGVDLAQV
jgi:hypothetical protein